MPRRHPNRLPTVLAITLLLGLAAPTPASALWGDTFAEETRRIVEALALGPGSVVADIGAGDGRYAFALAGVVGPTGHVYATEIDPDDLAELRTEVAERGLTNVTVLEAAVATTGLAESCCDAVLMRDVYHHLTDPVAIDASVLAALRPGGRFAVIDFPPTAWLAPWTPEGVPADRGGHGVTPEVVEREVEAAGFDKIALHDDWPSGWLASFVTRLYCVVFRKPGS